MSFKRFLIAASVLVVALSPLCLADQAPKPDIVLKSLKDILGFTETKFKLDYDGEYLGKIVKFEDASVNDSSFYRLSEEGCYAISFSFAKSGKGGLANREKISGFPLYNKYKTLGYFASTDDGISIMNHIEKSTKSLILITQELPCDLYFKIVNRKSKREDLPDYNFPVAELIWIEFKK